MDRRERAVLFRDRLSQALAGAARTRSALARAAGVSRSTISQLLDAETTRLPNAQLAADCAAILGVSADWLLGLTDRPERPGDVIAAAVQLADANRAPADDQFQQWYQEARGQKIRHVPATLPEFLKTEALLRWEYSSVLGKTADQAIAAMRERIDWLETGQSDLEIAMPLQELWALAEGGGYYRGLSEEIRREQLQRFAEQAEAHYPTLRLFLFDERRLYSAPVTIFGRFLGAIYVGRFYLAFRERERVGSLTQHFDWLVREAEVDGRNVAEHVRGLLAGN